MYTLQPDSFTISLSLFCVFGTSPSSASVFLQADGTTGRSGELCARHYSFPVRFCVVPSIPVSFSVHYTPHPPLLALVIPSVSLYLSF